MLEEVRSFGFSYEDSISGREASGHVAQLILFKQGNDQLLVANTHLRWDPPATSPKRSYGHLQASELMARCRRLTTDGAGLVVCGDFNAAPDSDVVAITTAAGLESTHRYEANQNTSNANGEA